MAVLDAGADTAGVAREVADGRIHLAQGQARHAASPRGCAGRH